MGEARYYLKAKIPNLSSKRDEIKEFFVEVYRAEEYFHENTGTVRESFWAEFAKMFPATCDLLKDVVYNGKHVLGGDISVLYGLLCYSDTMSMDTDPLIDCAGDQLKYSAEVWHFADWDPIVPYLKRRWGATRAGWLSDEWVDPDYWAYIKMK